MYTDVILWQKLRHRILQEGVSRRQIMRETGMHWTTVRKILIYPLPIPHKKYARTKRRDHGECLSAIIHAAHVLKQCLSALPLSHLPKKELIDLIVSLSDRGINVPSLHTVKNENIQQMSKMLAKNAICLPDVRAMLQTGEAEKLMGFIRNGSASERTQALSVMAYAAKINTVTIARFLGKSSDTITRYINQFRKERLASIPRKQWKRRRLEDNEEFKKALFTLLHAPPSQYSINRTSWKMEDLVRCLSQQGLPHGKDAIRNTIRAAGFKWRQAKVVLTSNDPDYRKKLDHIQSILSTLGTDERFFSVDEFGPFAVKAKGGRRLVAADDYPSVPQHQKSKGCLIITAALELSQNQITHFYSKTKNTTEMLRLLEILLVKYRGCKKLYLSWDAASWHVSNALQARVADINAYGHHDDAGTPLVELVPLPACAQFLNVIESVFSGMAKAIIHNSDYQSVEEAMTAIDRYFEERNCWFQENPKKAGQKIWGAEKMVSMFSETNNCKDPKWR